METSSNQELAYCAQCQQNRSVADFGRVSGSALRPQCNPCRRSRYKQIAEWRRACKEAEAAGTPLPPKPASKNSNHAPTGHLNDYKCHKCNQPMKRQNVGMHEHYVCHSTQEPRKECDLCNYKTDCHGDIIEHKKRVHNVTVDPPIKNKIIYTCEKHITEHKLAYQREYYKQPEQKAKTNARRAQNSVHQRMQRRAYCNQGDAAGLHQKSKPNDPAKYEQSALRKSQKRFQEKTLITRQHRIQWRRNNKAKVRETFRRYYAKNREQRMQASRVYRLGNTALRFKQLCHGAHTRNLEVTIAEDKAREMMLKSCFYCGGPPEEVSTVGLNGIDRLNNAVGYTYGNCVPCCPSLCNIGKNAFNVKVFLSKVLDIFRHLNLADLSQQNDAFTETDANCCTEEDYEDKILAWTNGVTQKILTNIEVVRSLAQSSQVDPLVGYTEISRNHFKSYLSILQDMYETIKDIPQYEFEDANSCNVLNLIRATNSEQEAKTLLEDMIHDVETLASEFKRVLSKQYNVHWAGNIEWKLTDEESVALVFKNQCTYCGTQGDLGIDRIDSSKAYTIDNVVPCCSMCNIIKGPLSLTTFLDRVMRIHDTLKLSDGMYCRTLEQKLKDRAKELDIPLLQGTAAAAPHETRTTLNGNKTKCRRVTDTALVALGRPSEACTFHCRPCGGNDKGKTTWAVVNVNEVQQMYPRSKMCSVCITGDETAPDCRDELLNSPTYTRLDDLRRITGRVERKRVSEFIITDMMSKYHTHVHTQVKFPLAVVRKEFALACKASLAPCSFCVSESPYLAIFDGNVDTVQRFTTLEEVKQFHANAIVLAKRDAALRKRISTERRKMKDN